MTEETPDLDLARERPGWFVAPCKTLNYHNQDPRALEELARVQRTFPTARLRWLCLDHRHKHGMTVEGRKILCPKYPDCPYWDYNGIVIEDVWRRGLKVLMEVWI